MGLDQIVTLANDCVNMGGFVFTKVGPHLKLIASVGNFVFHLNTMDKPNGVMLKLGELERQIGRLKEHMSDKFEELKSFVVEQYFWTEFAQTASTLLKYFQDVCRDPSKHNIKLFKEAVERTPPFHFAYKFISIFEEDHTNPLRTAMNSDTYKKRATFEKWEKIVDSVLAELLFLETIANGMFHGSNMIEPEKLERRIKEVQVKIALLRCHYVDSCWPETVKKIMEDVQHDKDISGHDNKALAIKNHLMACITDDVFYIIVYDECSGYGNHSFNGYGDQYMVSFREGGCNVVIYRSFHFKNRSNADYERIKEQVESCRHNVIPHKNDYAGYPKELWDERFNNCGFVGLIRKQFHPAIRSANAFGVPWGPGWWITAEVHYVKYPNSRGAISVREDFILIAGFY